MLSEEEKKAIDNLFNLQHINTYLDLSKESFRIENKTIIKWKESIAIVLNLITKLQKENVKKDKRLNRQFKLLNKKDKELEKNNKILNLILKKFKEGTEYYYSEFDYMSEEEIYKYFENLVKGVK